MTELSKKDLKEAVIESLEPFAKTVQRDFKSVNIRLDSFDSHLDSLDTRFSSVEADVKWMKENSGVLFAKLDKFITLLEKNEQEILMLSHQVKRLEERIQKLESRQQ